MTRQLAAYFATLAILAALVIWSPLWTCAAG